MNATFLSSAWSDITAFNYAIDPFVLRPFVPLGTELDFFEDQTFVSVIALNYEKPRFLGGVPVLLYPQFPVVTFRFYVRRKMHDGSYRRGTVFLKEFIPHATINTFAHLIGKRDASRMPITSHVLRDTSYLFWWGRIVDNNFLEAKVEGQPKLSERGTLADFILEKEWDFVPLTGRRTLQYRAVHPRWKIWSAKESAARVDASSFLSGDIARALRRDPVSAFVAEGSRVKVQFPRLIAPARRLSTKPRLVRLN